MTAVPTYALVRVRELWPSIDLYYRSQQPNLEFDLVLKPGADLRRVRVRFDGASAVRLDENGDLVLVTAAGEIRQHRPLSFQENQDRAERSGVFVRAAREQHRFLSRGCSRPPHAPHD